MKMNEIDPTIILSYLSDNCKEEELVLINLWVEESEQNKKWLFDTKALWDMEQFKKYENAEYLETQFLEMWNKVKDLSPKKQPSNKDIVKVIGYIAAACLIGFIVGFWLLKSPSSSLPEYIVEKVSSSDSIRRIILPDHSVVWLNANSQIKYLPQFEKSERKILLAGEAYFEVKPDKEKPFRVETSDFTIRVLGTTFNVASYHENDFSDATLILGKVVIENKRKEEILVLNPGQKARYSKEKESLVVEKVDTETETAWKNTYISFEHTGIKQIIKKLEYIYNEQITLQLMPDSHFVKTYSGAVAREDSLDLVLKNLQNVIPFNFEKNHEGFIISMKTK